MIKNLSLVICICLLMSCKKEIDYFPYPIKDINIEWEVDFRDTLSDIRAFEGMNNELFVAGNSTDNSIVIIVLDLDGEIIRNFKYKLNNGYSQSITSNIIYDYSSNLLFSDFDKIIAIDKNGVIKDQVQFEDNIFRIEKYKSGYLFQSNWYLYRVSANFNVIWKTFMANYNDVFDLIHNEQDIYCVTSTPPPNDMNYDIEFVKINNAGNEIFHNSYGGSNADYPFSMCFSNDSSIIASVGLTHSYDGDLPENKGQSDIWYYLFDLEGNLLHSTTFGGAFRDIGLDIVPYSEGFLFTSYTNENELRLFHVDESGQIIWQSILGYDFRMDFFKTSDNGFILTPSKYMSETKIVKIRID